MVWSCAFLAIAMAIYPFARACFRFEGNYNEGWNVYNASTVAHHQLLYGARPGWTTVNYPMLSFVVVALLQHVTHDLLFTARVLSLLGLVVSSALVGAIVRQLRGSRRAAILASFFCLAVFCTDADSYVGIDDPQIFAQMFFLAGLLVYLWKRNSPAAIAAAALLFVAGGSIKHNPIDFPLTVLLDLALVAPRRALWFAGCGLALAGASVALNMHFGGPYFVSQIVAPRSYSTLKAMANLLYVFGPLLLPFSVAVGMAFAVRKDPKRRIAAILLGTSLLLGGYFGGGRGVSINALFSALLAMTILLGLFWDQVRARRWLRMEWVGADFAPLILFGWLLIPWLLVPWLSSETWNPVLRLRDAAAAEKRFQVETAFLRARNGPALCESLLQCYFAGKPYVYDPFNATRLIEARRLNETPMVNDLRNQRYGAVQFDHPIEQERNSERWNPTFIAAIEANYVPALMNQDGEIYVPKTPVLKGKSQ
jgi:hypothetical protein